MSEGSRSQDRPVNIKGECDEYISESDKPRNSNVAIYPHYQCMLFL